MHVLYDAVGFGMWAYSHAAFAVEVLPPRRFRLEPQTLILVTHRRESDVPVVGPTLYFGARLWRNRSERMAFAARSDMFVRGFFAGFPETLGPRARRLFWGIDIASMLPRVDVYPIGSAQTALVKEVLEEKADAQLGDALPAEPAEAFAARAAEVGLPPPTRARDVLRGEYADLLWRTVARDEVGSAGLERLWARRGTQAAADFRSLVDLVRSGRTLLVFPEGRPSPDGEIGPLRRGVDALIRRAHPRHVLPIALAYDPLVRGRTRVLVCLGAPVAPPTEDVEQTLLALLRRTMPLTCGQYVARELVAGGTPTPAGLAAEVDAAVSEGRRVESALLSVESRNRRLAAAVVAAERRGDELPYLALEYESARAG